MPTGGFKLLDTAEVKMAFSGYTMFLCNNNIAPQNPNSGTSGGSWLSNAFSKDKKPCLALTANEAKSTDRSNFNTNHICAVALRTPTQIAPSGPTAGSGASENSGKNNGDNNNDAKKEDSNNNQKGSNSPFKYDPELILAARTHRMHRDQGPIGEVYSLNPPMNSSASSGVARIRDCETLVLRAPAVAVVGLYNNYATLFALVDPASSHPKSSSAFQNSISDADKLIPVQSIRFAVRCTAFTTFTTHTDFSVAHGLSPIIDEEINTTTKTDQQQNERGPFQPFCELWSVFGFGSGDVIIWSHAQEAMLKRHNNCSTLTADLKNEEENNNNNKSSAVSVCSVEPGVAVSAIARVERGLTEQATTTKWKNSSSSSSSSSSNKINTQVASFCDLVVGYENGTILVISLNATGGFVNQKLSGWFGFSAIRSIRACPISPYLLGVGSDDGTLRFMSFPWSFDVERFEKELQLKQKQYSNLTAADIGTGRDPRVLCCVPGAVSGGGVTCVSWEAHGEAVVCTGDDDAVSIVSIESTPSLQSLRDIVFSSSSDSQAQQPSSPTGSSPSYKSLEFSLQLPLQIQATAIHRRNFHKSWVCGSMILSLDVMNTNPKTRQQELRQVTTVYTAALDGAVVAGAAFPATQILHSPRSNNNNKNATNKNRGGSSGNQLDSFDGGENNGSNNNSTNIMTRHSSIRIGNNDNQNASSSSSAGGGLAIRHRPLARFLQMARSDTVLNFASIGDYGQQQDQKQPQRKRSFVTITAKGTVALWTFYDLLVESEIPSS